MSRWIYKGINYFQYVTLESVERTVLGQSDEGKSEGSLETCYASLSPADKEAFDKQKAAFIAWQNGQEKVY
jgi:hypothetical protein